MGSVQWNPVNTDTKGTGQNVRINGVSVLSGVSEKSHRYMFYRYKDEGKRLYGNKMLFNCTLNPWYGNTVCLYNFIWWSKQTRGFTRTINRRRKQSSSSNRGCCWYKRQAKDIKEEEAYKRWLQQKAKEVKLLNRNSSQKTILKDSRTRAEHRKSRYWASLCNKIVLTLQILSLFDQGPISK